MIMSSGRFMLPSSAMVVPRTLPPASSAAIGNFTSGVRRSPAMKCGSPAIGYGRKVYTGDRVCHAVAPVIISTLTPPSTLVNGYGIALSLSLNSSFDSPATHNRPSTSAMSVTVSIRAPRPMRPRGGLGSVTRE